MYAHEDDDSRGSVGSPTQGEFDHGSISGGEEDLDDEYNDYAENSEAENNQAASGEEEFDCPRVSPQPLPIAEPISPEVQPPTSSKKIQKRKPAAAKSVPASRTAKPGHEEQAVSAGAGEKKKALVLPKKRPAVKPVAKGDGVDLAKKSSAPKKKPSSKLKDPMEKASCALPSDESRNKTKVTVKKSRKLVSAATDKPPVKKGRQDVKHRSEEAASSLPTINGMSPTLVTAELQAHTLPQPNVPRKKKTSDETSAKNSSVLNSESSDRRFWMETLAGDFKSPGYNALLKSSNFTEQQANVLQQSFYQLCRKLSDISTYSDRFMKTHKCIECEFSISHQCVSIDFTQYVPSSANVTGVTTITPQSTTMCICQFGFFHSHATQPRLKLANNVSLKSTLRMLEHNRSVSVSCPRCHMNVVIKNRNSDVCCDFTNWNSLEGGNRRQFFNSLENRLQTSKMSRPYLNELYTCNRQCCQLFHRCAENAVADNTISTRPH